MTKSSTYFSLLLAGGLSLLGVALLACQTLKAWPEQKPESEPSAAEWPAQEEEKVARTDRHDDPLPSGALARLGTMRLRHNAEVQSLAFTPDGKGLLTAGGDNLPRLWDAATGKLLREFTNIPKPQILNGAYWGVSGALLSPDGRILAVRSGPQRSLYLLESATGKRLHEFACATGPAGNDPFMNFAFSPDSKTIAAQIDGRLELRDVATGRPLWQMNKTHVIRLAFSPDGKILAMAEGRSGAVSLWDAHTGKPLSPRHVGFECRLPHMAFSPDGRMLAICGGGPDPKDRNENCFFLWDVATRQKIRQLGTAGTIYRHPVFSPDGKIVAASEESGIYFWEVDTGKELRRCPTAPVSVPAFGPDAWPAAPGGPRGRALRTRQVAFSPDGKVVAVLDDRTVRFWDTATGKALPSLLPAGHESTVNALAFTPDGQTLISTASDRTVRWWGTSTGRQQLCQQGPNPPSRPGEISEAAGRACTSALSRDGRVLAVAHVEPLAEKHPAKEQGARWHAGIRLLDAATGKELRRLDSGNGRITGLSFSPNGKMLAEVFWAADGAAPVVRLWDAASGKRVPSSPLAGTCPLFSPDGSLLVTGQWPYDGSPNALLRFWQTATGREVYSFRTNERIECLALSPDGKTLAASGDGITLYPLSWDKPSGVRVGAPRRIASSLEAVTALAFSPDRRMADMVWPNQLENCVTALTFSPDGRLLAASGSYPTIRVWELASGQERARFHGHSRSATARSCSVTSLAFTADGRRLASGGADSTILLWDMTGRLQDGRLQPAAETLRDAELGKLWADLGSSDAARAGRALWTFAATPAQAVPYLQERLRASKADTYKALAKAPQFLRDLDDDSFSVRSKAKAELRRLGKAAEPVLRQALAKSSSLEVRRSLEQLLKETESQQSSGELLRGMRALEALEQIGSREARAVLKTLTDDAEAESPLTHEAHITLERLDRAERR